MKFSCIEKYYIFSIFCKNFENVIQFTAFYMPKRVKNQLDFIVIILELMFSQDLYLEASFYTCFQFEFGLQKCLLLFYILFRTFTYRTHHLSFMACCTYAYRQLICYMKTLMAVIKITKISKLINNEIVTSYLSEENVKLMIRK